MSSHGETAKRANIQAKPMAPASEMIFALKALKPSSRSQKAARFGELFDVIQELMGQDVYQKDIIATLATLGLSLSPLTFKQYFDAEKMLREENKPIIVPQPSETSIPLVIDSESSPRDNFTTRIGESVEHVHAEKTQGLTTTKAGEHAVGGAP